jgi:hypothetical protein
MRAKTLILITALGALGLASVQGQVFSVNIVGYVNVELAGDNFSLITNPLVSDSTDINDLIPTAPAGSKAYQYNSDTGTFAIGTYDDLDEAWIGDEIGLWPGNGVFFWNQGGDPITVTFVGEVKQGELSTPLAAGFSIVSSQAPIAGTANELGLPSVAGMKVYQWNGGGYNIATYDDLDETYLGDVTIGVGEAFWVNNPGDAGSWDVTFNVNE